MPSFKKQGTVKNMFKDHNWSLFWNWKYIVLGKADMEVRTRLVQCHYIFYPTKRSKTSMLGFTGNYTYPRTVRVQYLRILLSSFGEEDFQKSTVTLNLTCSN